VGLRGAIHAYAGHKRLVPMRGEAGALRLPRPTVTPYSKAKGVRRGMTRGLKPLCAAREPDRSTNQPRKVKD